MSSNPPGTAALPQTPGALIVAEAENMGKVRTRLFFRRAYPDDPAPWISQQDICDRAWWHDSDLTLLRVIHDPGTTT